MPLLLSVSLWLPEESYPPPTCIRRPFENSPGSPLTIDVFLLSLLKVLTTSLQPAQQNCKMIAKTYTVLPVCVLSNFPHPVSFISHEAGAIISLVLEMRKLSTERLNNLPRVTQPVSGRVGI